MKTKDIVKKLGLKPLPVEGGFFREMYRSQSGVSAESLPEGFDGPRPWSTSIYYMLIQGVCSRMHRLPSDEIWHHYLGGPVRMLILHPSRKIETPLLGSDIENGQRPQVVVPKGSWQGAMLDGEDEFALMGTTVSPGFDFTDFEAGDQKQLVEGWPEAKELIQKLSPKFIIPLT